MLQYSYPSSALLNNPLFRGPALEGGDRARLLGLGLSLKRYDAHTTVAKQGSRDGRVIIVQSGWGCLARDLPNGERQIIDFPLAGDVLGLRADMRELQFSLTAITDLIVCEMRASSVIEGCTRSQRLTEIFFAAAARRQSIMVEHLTNLGRRSAFVRTAHLLLELGERLKAAGLSGEGGYDCPLTQYELADALGLTAIHVNRMLRELREKGYIYFRHGEVEFLNKKALKDFVDYDKSSLYEISGTGF